MILSVDEPQPPRLHPPGKRCARAAIAVLSLALAAALSASAATRPHASHASHVSHASHASHTSHRKPHRAGVSPTGHRQVGLASYYSHRFAGRRMADGTRLRLESDSAASRTLPLGTTARVRNLHNGRTALVTIRDRGPHARGRIIDLSPRVARQLGITGRGVARVEVVALRIPARAGARSGG